MMNDELVVVDECEEDASDAPFASAGIGLIIFLLKFNKYRRLRMHVENIC